VVVTHEDAKIRGPGEALRDPPVVLTPDLTLVEVGLGRVDGDERDLEPVELEPPSRVSPSEGVLEQEITDVPCVVVPRDAHDVGTLDRAKLLAGKRVLIGKTVVGEVTGDDDEVRFGCVDLLDRRRQKLTPIAAPTDMDVRDLCDQHHESLSAFILDA